MRYSLHQTLTLSLLALSLTLAGCTLPGVFLPEATPAVTPTPSPLGTEANPIVLAARPGSEEDALEAAGRIAEQVSNLTGLVIVTGQVESTQYLIESLGEGTVHIALLSPFAYLSAREKGYAEAALAGVREGRIKFGAQFLVNAQLAGVNGYKLYFDEAARVNTAEASIALAQFANKQPCWSDAFSPAGYVLPLGALNLQGVAAKPGLFLQGDEAVIRTVYQDKKGSLCEFGVSLIDSRAGLIEELPDVNEQVRVVWQTEEVIPTDGFAFGASLTQELRYQIVAALLVAALQQPSDIRSAFGVDGLQIADDTFYADLRAALQLSGLPLDALLR